MRLERFARQLVETMPQPGDLVLGLCSTAESKTLVADAVLSLLGLGPPDPDAPPIFRHVWVLVHDQFSMAEVEGLIDAGIDALAQLRQMPVATLRELLRRRIHVREAREATMADVRTWWEALPAADAAVILGAGMFASGHESPSTEYEASAATPFADTAQARYVAYERVWVPRVVALAQWMRQRQPRPYTMVVSGLHSMGDVASEDELRRCFDAIFSMTAPEVAQTLALIRTRIPGWVSRLRAVDDPQEVMREIDSVAEGTGYADDVFTKVLVGAGRVHEAWARLEPTLHDLSDDDFTQRFFAIQVALYSGQVEPAARLLDEMGTTVPSDPSLLLSAVDLAGKLERKDLEDHYLDRLVELAPEHPQVRRMALFRHMQRQQWDRARQLVEDDRDLDLDDDVRRVVALEVGWELGESTGEEFIERAATIDANARDVAIGRVCGRHLDEGRIHAALAVLSSAAPTGRAGRAWLRAFNDICRGDPEEVGDIPIDAIFGRALECLARRPGDTSLRHATSDRFEEGATATAATAIALNGLPALECPDALEWPAIPVETDHEAVVRFIEGYMSRRPRQAVNTSVPERLGADELPPNPEQLYWSIYEWLEALCTAPGVQYDPDGIPIPLKVGVDLAVSMDGDDVEGEYRALDLYTIVARGAAINGHPQIARNLAESVLQVGARTSHDAVKRAAWFGYADILVRCGSRIESLLGLACCQRLSAAPTRPRDAINVFQLAIRVLREFGLLDHAQAMADVYVTKAAGASRTLSVRANFLAASIRAGRVMAQGGDALAEFLEHTTSLIADALSHGGELGPLAILHAQVARACEAHGLPVSDRSNEMMDAALDRSPPQLQARVGVLRRSAPDPDHVFGRMLEEARTTAYVEDLATDRSETILLARRLLRSCPPDEAFTAIRVIEGLTDVAFESDAPTDLQRLESRVGRGYQTLLLEGKTLPKSVMERAAGPVSPTTTPSAQFFEHPERLRDELHRWTASGLDVHFMGLDNRDELVHVIQTADRDPQIVAASSRSFSFQSLKTWSTSRPEPQTEQEVRDTLAGIEIATLDPSSTATSAFITSVDLAKVPLNLLLRDGEFAGSRGPVVSVPSVAWVSHWRRRHADRHSPEATAPKLWVFPAPPADGEQVDALGVIGRHLSKTLAGRDVEIVLGASQDEIVPSTVNIVAAHGELGLTGRYFSGLTDGFQRRYDSEQLVEVLAGSEVVVLLICSGGRIEQASRGWMTTGLPRMLLNRGVRSVVASPWPLTVATAVYWIGPFLDFCRKGMTVAEATYHANLAVRTRLPAPADWLAMHAFGDPEVSLPGVDS